MKKWPIVCLALGLVVLTSGCRSLRRDINASLPEFMRSDPGADQREIIQRARRARDYTVAERERQAEEVVRIRAIAEGDDPEDTIDEIELFLEEFPDSEYDEELRMLLVEEFLRDDEYAEAWVALREFGERFPVSERSPRVLELGLVIGKSYLAGEHSYFFGLFGNERRGREVLEWLVRSYPASLTAAEAQWTLANDAIDRSEFQEAALSFDFFVQQYPTSAYVERAYYLRAWSRWRLVKGVFYDPEIKRIAREQFQEFLDRSPEDMELAADAIAKRDELFEMEASYHLEVARWYEDQGRPFSARFYYAKVDDLFPESAAAAEARAALSEVSVEAPIAEPVAPPEPQEEPEENAPAGGGGGS